MNEKLEEVQEALDEIIERYLEDQPIGRKLDELKELFSAFQELSLSAPSKEPSLRKRPRKRDIERLWVKWIHVKENSKMSLNDAEGFNGFVLGYELKEREKVSGVEEK